MEASRQTYKTKVSQWERIHQFLAEHDVPGLRRVMLRAGERNMPPPRIEEILGMAAEGKYRPHGAWSKRELDIAFLATASASRRSAGVVSRANGYATESTVRRRFDIPRLLVSLSRPTSAEIERNICSFFRCELLKPPEPTGIWGRSLGSVLMWDNMG